MEVRPRRWRRGGEQLPTGRGSRKERGRASSQGTQRRGADVSGVQWASQCNVVTARLGRRPGVLQVEVGWLGIDTVIAEVLPGAKSSVCRPPAARSLCSVTV